MRSDRGSPTSSLSLNDITNEIQPVMLEWGRIGACPKIDGPGAPRGLRIATTLRIGD